LEAADELESLGEARFWLCDLARFHRMEALVLFPRAVSAALDPLLEGGLEPVVLKGPWLAARYPEPGLRPMDDIDVLLPSEQHHRALRLLEKSGWRVARSGGRDRYDAVLVNPEVPSLSLEMHYGFEASYERVTSLDPHELWERRIPIECLGTSAFGLPLPEEIVSLSAHAGKPYHGFSRMLWIADLAMAVGHHLEAGGHMDWDKVHEVAAEARCTTVVSAALRLARHAGMQAPLEKFPIPPRGWRSSALGRLLEVDWPVGGPDLATYHLRYALTDGWWRRGRLLLGSGHGMTITRRVKWSAGAPIGALSRWRELRSSAPSEPGLPRS